MKRFCLFTIFLLTMVFHISAGSSEIALSRASAKIGYNTDFEQLVLGGDINLGTISDNLYLVPQIELSIGSDYNVFSIDGTVQYYIPSTGSIKPYFGGGLGLRTVSWEVAGFDGSDTDFVLCVLGGADYDIGNPRMNLFSDIKIRFLGWGSDLGIWFGISFDL